MMTNLKKRPLIIAGPCSAESREQTIDSCLALAKTGKVDVLRAGVWKPRTKPGGFEGMGLKALSWMAEVKQQTGLPVAVEVATAKHVESALEFGIDILWIGARTTGNPFSIQEIADALRGVDIPIMIKNPMNPDIDLWGGAVARLLNVGVKRENIILIHRGFSYFGSTIYRNAPMWHLALEMRNRFPDIPMICDPSHICGGRDLIGDVSQKAADLCFDGLIVESHCCPEKALSDASQQFIADDFEKMIDSVVWRQGNVEDSEFQNTLDLYRRQIDQLDAELFDLLSRRMRVAEKIGEVKRANNVTILQSRRWGDIKEKIVSQSQKLQLSEEFVRTVLEAIHTESINRQNYIMNK